MTRETRTVLQVLLGTIAAVSLIGFVVALHVPQPPPAPLQFRHAIVPCPFDGCDSHVITITYECAKGDRFWIPNYEDHPEIPFRLGK